MNTDTSNPTDYNVGYRKPPVSYQFQKGVSGNPKGRPKGSRREHLAQVLIEEIFRTVTVREDGNAVEMPMAKAVMRHFTTLTLKAGPREAERWLELATKAVDLCDVDPTPDEGPRIKLEDLTPNDRARRIAFVLARAARDKKKGEQAAISAGVAALPPPGSLDN